MSVIPLNSFFWPLRHAPALAPADDGGAGASAAEKTPAPEKGVALVTGAAKRIGRQIAIRLAEDGYAIAVHHNASGDEAKALVEELEANGARAATVQGDLSDADAVSEIIPAVSDRLGAPGVLINNASLFLDDRLEDFDLALWEKHQAVNLRSPLQLASAMARHLPPGQLGNVINLIDQRVWKLTPEFFSYTLSKAALWTATKTMAQALAPRVRVNAIGPGPVLRSIHQTDSQFAAECAATVLGRGTTPDEIANGVRFILDAPALTGQMIALDGGQHLAWQTPDVVALGE